MRRRTGRRHDDETLMRDLYAEHGRMLLAYANRLTGDHSVAEDLVQETLIRAWRHFDTVAGARCRSRAGC
jgi:RNA polymerase sigma-70 factor (ECF subfamily)